MDAAIESKLSGFAPVANGASGYGDIDSWCADVDAARGRRIDGGRDERATCKDNFEGRAVNGKTGCAESAAMVASL